MNQYIVYRKTDDHECFLLQALNLKAALRSYALNMFATERSDGLLELRLPGGPSTVFSHEMEAIECVAKARSREWTIFRLEPTRSDTRLSLPYSCVGEELNNWYIQLCREQFGAEIELSAKAFVWFFFERCIVTFYNDRDARTILPSDISYRFLFTKITGVNAKRWDGDYDSLLLYASNYERGFGLPSD